MWQDQDPGTPEGRDAYAIAAKYEQTFAKAFLEAIRTQITPEIERDFRKAWKSGSPTAVINSIPFFEDNPDSPMWERFTEKLGVAYLTVIQAAGDEATKDLNKKFKTNMDFTALPPPDDTEVVEKAAITGAMLTHFYDRTKRHIGLVQKYCTVLEKAGVEGLVERGEEHDSIKYEEPELEPYIWLTWRYKCKDDGTECVLPKGMEDAINVATQHHILNSRHHPEYHQTKTLDVVDENDRDAAPDEIIDASGMGDLDIAEMVADWCAMAEERGNTPRAWADKSVDVRWKFTPNQKKRIYKLIDLAWKASVQKSMADVRQAAAGMTVDVNPYSIDWVRQHGLDLVADGISPQQKEVVTNIIQQQMEIGARPTDALDQIKSNIGLTAREHQAVLNREVLHIESGLPADKIESLTGKYREKLLSARAQRIARTETIAAQAQGRKDAWLVAQDSGKLPKVQRRWLAPPPSPNPNRPCEICLDLDGKTAALKEPYESMVGPLDGPPAHPS
jgi:hypothetical protein